MIYSAVTTCSKNSEERSRIFLRSVLSIKDSGFSDVMPSVDGTGVCSDVRVGITPHYRRTLGRLVAISSRPNDILIVFQDDVLVARNLREWLKSNMVPNGIASLYSTDSMSSGWVEKEFREPSVSGFGCCAIAYRRSDAVRILDAPPPKRIDRLGSWIGSTCYRLGISISFHNPSLVQHIGDHTANGYIPLTEDRVAANFCEDALEVP